MKSRNSTTITNIGSQVANIVCQKLVSGSLTTS